MKNIRNIAIILIWVIAIALTSCGNIDQSEPAWTELPEVTSLTNLKQTDIVLTLENPVAENKNIIYAPSFLYAWDKVKDKLKFPIVITNGNSPDFKLLNRSTSYQNSLTDTEYSATAEVINGAIVARAFFNKTLPFSTRLQILAAPIIFDTTKVSAFGMQYYDEDILKVIKILYYKDDNNFILKLLPKDEGHEIILIKGLGKYQTLNDAVQLADGLIKEGKQEQVNKALSWKYEIVQSDIFSIPVIKFNIAKKYESLEGQKFSTNDNKSHSVEEAYQRTGFILNEDGAVVESEALVKVDSIGSDIVAHPKKMIFDRPFLIIIKRVGQTNPYFVMKVANAELLTRE